MCVREREREREREGELALKWASGVHAPPAAAAKTLTAWSSPHVAMRRPQWSKATSSTASRWAVRTSAAAIKHCLSGSYTRPNATARRRGFGFILRR
jgi:hypothetical protein